MNTHPYMFFQIHRVYNSNDELLCKSWVGAIGATIHIGPLAVKMYHSGRGVDHEGGGMGKR